MSLYEQWVKTLEQVELKPISDDKACKISCVGLLFWRTV